jgi:hypothetical protein
MKIEYKSESFILLGFDEFKYVLVKPIEYCCDELEKAVGNRLLGFGSHPEYPEKNANFNLYENLCFPEGTAYEEHKINYCPFCGEKIECVEVPLYAKL